MFQKIEKVCHDFWKNPMIFFHLWVESLIENIALRVSAIIFIIFWDFLLFYQIFFFNTSETKRDF